MIRKHAVLAAAIVVLVAAGVRAQSDPSIWRSDLDLIATELPKRHINLFFKLTPADFRARVEQLKARLPEMNDDERYVEMAKLVAAVGDTHTALSQRPMRMALPVMLYRFRDGLYIVNTTEEHRALLNGQITALGGRPIAEVERAIGDMVSHENDAAIWQALTWAPARTDVLRGLRIISDGAGVPLTVRNSDGAMTTTTMAAVSTAQRPQWIASVPVGEALPLYRRDANKFYWYDYVPSTKVVYVKYNSCQEMKDRPFADFVREVFAALDRVPDARLVVDLRNNGGGDGRVFQPFLDALRQRPALGEKRRLFVVVGRQTFSSAILNAVSMKQEGKAILVGEPTAGRPNHYGEIQRMDLPGTGLKVSYSTRYFKRVADDPVSLHPDMRVDLTIGDYVAGRDPVLERIVTM